MAETYTSPQARRRAALSQALLSGAMTAPQGGMVGRYYVGEGLGGGMTRIGQALLANSLGKRADEAEGEYVAGQRAKRAEAMSTLVNDITKPREEVLENYDGELSGLSRTTMRKPTSQEIGAALLKYQSETGQDIDKNMLGLLAPDAVGGDELAFGNTLTKNGRTYQLTKSGKLIDLGEGFDTPTRVLDLGGQLVVTPTAGAPKPVATFTKGLKPEDKPQTAAEIAAAKAAAEATAKADAQRASGQVDKGISAGSALDLLRQLIGALERTPENAAGRAWETAVGVFGAGNEAQQNAMGEVERIGKALVPFAQREPGPSTDRDVQNYMSQMGVLDDPLARRSTKIAAARSAMESLAKIHAKYGQNWQPAGATKPGNKPALDTLIPLTGGR